MKQVFRPYISKFVVVYFGDMLIYNRTKEEPRDHLTYIMMILEKESFMATLKSAPSSQMRSFF